MSLLKRIEQGQTDESPTPPTEEEQPFESGGSGGTSRLKGLSARRTAPPGQAPGGRIHDIKNEVQNRLLQELDPSMDVTQTADVRRQIEELL